MLFSNLTEFYFSEIHSSILERSSTQHSTSARKSGWQRHLSTEVVTALTWHLKAILDKRSHSVSYNY